MEGYITSPASNGGKLYVGGGRGPRVVTESSGGSGDPRAEVLAAPELGEEIDRRILLRPPVRPVSVTDLVDPRPAYHRVVHPIPIPPERRGRVEEGREQHERTERLLAEPLHREIRVAREGIVGRLDIFDERPTEIKSTGALPPIERLAELRPQYIDQLALYCALVERPEGRLILVRASPEGSPSVLVADGRFRDLPGLWEATKRAAEALRTALSGRDPSRLPRCGWFDRGCEYQAAAVCACTGSEPEEAEPPRAHLESIRSDIPAAEEVQRRLGRAREAPPELVLRSYRDLLYPRRAYFERYPPPEPDSVPPPASNPPSAPEEEGPSLYQMIREALEAGPVGELIREVPEGDAPAEPVLRFRGAPLLLKTTRSPFATPAGALAQRQPGYIAELGLRCAALGASTGWLVIGYERLSRAEGSIRTYQVRFADRVAWNQMMGARRAALRLALERRDPSGLPPCPEWMFEGCPYRAVCGDGPAVGAGAERRQR